MLNDNVSLQWTEKRYPQDREWQNQLRVDLECLFKYMGLDPLLPFADYVSPGDMILIKPNFVSHDIRYGPKASLDEMLTHPNIIRAMLVFCADSLRGRGSIIIGDAPIQWCKFYVVKEKLGFELLLKEFQQKYPQVHVEVQDWRLTTLDILGDGRFKQDLFCDVPAEKLKGYKLVDLVSNSYGEDITDFREGFRVTDYPPALIKEHHFREKHEYLIKDTFFQADMILNLAKWKTHKKSWND